MSLSFKIPPENQTLIKQLGYNTIKKCKHYYACKTDKLKQQHGLNQWDVFGVGLSVFSTNGRWGSVWETCILNSANHTFCGMIIESKVLDKIKTSKSESDSDNFEYFFWKTIAYYYAYFKLPQIKP